MTNKKPVNRGAMLISCQCGTSFYSTEPDKPCPECIKIQKPVLDEILKTLITSKNCWLTNEENSLDLAKSQILAEAERMTIEVINKVKSFYPHEGNVTVMSSAIYYDDAIKGIKTAFGGKEKSNE